MTISTLTFSDGANGRLFAAWVNEVRYAIGRHANFDNVDLPTSDTIVLSIVCLPANLAGAAKIGTTRKGGAGEFWSTAHASYFDFTSNDPIAKIDCIEAALTVALQQLPDSHMTRPVKDQLLVAIAKGAADFRTEPQRHPR